VPQNPSQKKTRGKVSTMENLCISARHETDDESTTAQVVRRFITAFETRDPEAIPDLVGQDCVMEGMLPAPDGVRVEGYADNVRVWQAMVSDTKGTFETEDLVILEDRAINRWRYRHREGGYVRGVTLIRVEDGKIVEALGYGKTAPLDFETAQVIDRFNDVFQRHDPSALPELVSADCVIENTMPAPDGARYVGKEACVKLWSGIATSPGTRFDLEEIVVAGERATIHWRLVWGDGAEDSVRGVNLMRVKDGQIVEALGYVKGMPSSR
jgi:ketosteroid isomerase-like protein